MSTPTGLAPAESSPPAISSLKSTLPLPEAAALATGLSVAGVFAVLSTALFLWGLWTTDPLKSIGGLIPIVSLVLILRAWRSLGWEMCGNWWGLAIVAVTIA